MQSLQDVTGAEFKMFMDFLKSLTLFNDKSPPERVQELLEIVEGQADLDAIFTVCSLIWFCCPYFFFVYVLARMLVWSRQYECIGMPWYREKRILQWDSVLVYVERQWGLLLSMMTTSRLLRQGPSGSLLCWKKMNTCLRPSFPAFHFCFGQCMKSIFFRLRLWSDVLAI